MDRLPSNEQNSSMLSPASSDYAVITVPESSAFTGQSPMPIFEDLTIQHLPGSPPRPATENHAAAVTGTCRYLEREERSLLENHSSFRDNLDEKGESTIEALGKLGWIFIEQGRYQSAEAKFRELIAKCRRTYSDRHAETLHAYRGFGYYPWLQGLYFEAEELLSKSMTASEKLLRPKHLATLLFMRYLAIIYTAQHRWKDGEKLAKQALNAILGIHGDEYPGTLTNMANRLLDEAEELGKRVVEIYMRVFGDEDPETLTSMSNLAATYRTQGRLEEADELGRRVLETRKRVLGDGHPDTLESIHDLALTKQHQRKREEALELLGSCVDSMMRVLGARHPGTLSSVERLAIWRREWIEVDWLC